MDTKIIMHWDWFTSWHKAEKEVHPSYGERGVIEGVFPTNVTFFIPTYPRPWDNATFYKVFRKEKQYPVVLFQPQWELNVVHVSWRGMHGSRPYLKSPQEMSKQIALSQKNIGVCLHDKWPGTRINNSFILFVCCWWSCRWKEMVCGVDTVMTWFFRVVILSARWVRKEKLSIQSNKIVKCDNICFFVDFDF